MPTIEQRLRNLEKQALIDAERWQTLRGHIKGVTHVVDCLGGAIAGNEKRLLRAIIANLKTFEDVARAQNEHEATVKRLRSARKFFDGLLKEIKGRS
jgi:hypothetical protein